MIVQLANGELIEFPPSMSDAEIEAALRSLYPPPAPEPAGLQPGEVLTRPNGCTVRFSAEYSRYFAYDTRSVAAGFRATLAEAIDLADRIPPPPPDRRKPKSPQPVSVTSPVGLERQAMRDTEEHIRRTENQQRRERMVARQAHRYRNRGTL